MSINEQYTSLCEARIEALEKEVSLLKEYIVREYAYKQIDEETAMNLFNAFKDAKRKENTSK
jgi:hypothetical protein